MTVSGEACWDLCPVLSDSCSESLGWDHPTLPRAGFPEAGVLRFLMEVLRPAFGLFRRQRVLPVFSPHGFIEKIQEASLGPHVSLFDAFCSHPQ